MTPPHIQKRRVRLAMATAAQVVATSGRPSDRSDLEIRGAAAYPVREPASGRAYTILRLETKSGLVGYGECTSISLRELEQVRQAVVGKSATAFEVLRRQLGRCVGAAVNVASLDLIGKFSNAPVYQVLGGPTRYKARALAPLNGTSDASLLVSMKRAQAAGFRAVSVPLPPSVASNQGRGFVLAARKRLEALREAGGGMIELVLDAAGVLSPGDAANLASEFETFHLLWLDEPCGAVQMGTLRRLAEEKVTPIGFGRRIDEGGPFQDLLSEDAIDVLRPDVGLNGVTQIRRMAAIAETYYVAVAPFHDGGPVSTAAALHLAAAIPNFYIQQIPLPEAEEDRRMRAECTDGSVEVVTDGFAALPTGPGLGITVNERVLEKYVEHA